MEKGVAEFAKLLRKESTSIFRDATTRVSNALVRKAPVDTGEFLADWDISIAGWPSDTKPPGDPGRRVTRARLKETINDAVYGEAIFFENTDPVAARLEFGYSKQAPNGFLRITARSWPRFVKGAARAAQNKIRKNLVIDG